MKKIFLLILITAFMTGNAFAALAVADNDGTGGLQLVGYTATSATGAQTKISRMSNNVYVTAEYNANGYTLSTYHSQGTKAYGTGYDSTSIFWAGIGENGITAGTFVAPTSSSADIAFAGWTAM